MRVEDQNSESTPLTVISEPNPSGHRLYYVKLLVDWCYSKGRRVTVLTTQQATESDQWRVHLQSLNPDVIVQPAACFTLSEVAAVAAKVNASLTVLSDGDRYLFSLLRAGWTGPGELSTLIMRADGQPGEVPFMRHVKGIVKKALILGVGKRGGVRISALRSPLVHRRGPLRWTPDPVSIDSTNDYQDELKDLLNTFGKRYWIGVFGVITQRKNLDLIAEAIQDLPDLGLLIGGAIDDEVRASVGPYLDRFDSGKGKVVYLPGTLTNAEFDSAIGVVDCVIVAHTNEGPSGVVLKAAASGTRLILSGAKSLRRDAIFLSDQATWCPLNAISIRAAIERASKLPRPQSRLEVGTQQFVNALA